MNTQKTFTLATVLVVVVLGSIFLGSAVGRQDTMTAIIAVSVIVVILIFVGLGDNIWVLVPVFAIWSGHIPLLPLPFSVSNLAVGFGVFAWSLALAARRQSWNFHFTGIDIILLSIVAILAAGYFRNPIGVAAFSNGSNIGARPYIEVGIALAGYVMLSSQRARITIVEKLPRWALISAVVIGLGGMIAFLVPPIGIVMYQFYTGFLPNMSAVLDPYGGNDAAVGRTSYTRAMAIAGAAYVGARCCPLFLVNPRKWGLAALFGIAVLAALVSGFRSAFVAVGFYFVFASWLWLRGRGILVCVAVAVLGIGTIAIVQQLVPVHERIQRTLSFVPANWDRSVIEDAEGSTEWRLEMWETVLEGDNIKNWWIGDGFGFPRSEMEYFSFLQRTNSATPEQMAEYYTITGDLHSGPLSAIKFAGVFGLILYVILAIAIAVQYVRLWGKLSIYGTSEGLRFTIGFFTIIAAYVPLKFLFIYGAYNNDLAPLILSAGMYRLLKTVCEEHIEESRDLEEGALA